MSEAKELVYTLALPAHRRPHRGEAREPSREVEMAKIDLTYSIRSDINRAKPTLRTLVVCIIQVIVNQVSIITRMERE